jgi:PAS domain S-box-containing protein
VGPRRRPPSAAALTIAGGAVLTAIFAILAMTRAGGLADLWDNLHWTVSIASATIAAAVARQSASGHERAVRSWAGTVLGTWLAGQLLWDIEGPLGLAAFPSPCDAFFLLTAVPLVGWVLSGTASAHDGGARWVALIDGSAVFLAATTVIVILFGEVAAGIGGFGGVLMIAYPTIFLGGSAAAITILAGRYGLRAIPSGPLAFNVGLAFVGLAWITWLQAARAGIAVTAGDPGNALFSIGNLVAGAALVVGAFRRPVLRHAASSQLGTIVPMLTALAAASILLGLDAQISPAVEPWVDLFVACAVVLVVARQTLLLRDGRATAERERVALAQAEEAVEQARRTARALTDAEERFRRLVEQIPAAVYLDRLDAERQEVLGTVYISPRVTALTGFSPEELGADRLLWDSRIHEDDKESVEAAWLRHSTAGVPFSAIYRFRTRDGRTIWLAEDAELIVTSDGQTFSQGLVVDITERRETEDRLRQAQKMEAVGQLAGGVAHDFNNLLTVITGHAGLLLETTADEVSRSDLEAIAAAAASSADLVGQLLAFGRRTMMRPEVTDLSSVVEDVIPMLRRLLPETIAIETTIGTSLPPVRVDPGQIQQVVLNLAINGRDAMPSGGRLRIRTCAREVGPAEAARMVGCKPGAYVELSIADEGIGMDAATRERVFEPFFTTKAAGRGTGLGLATVYGIVKQSDGYIALESSVDHGSTFRVLIPASADTAPARTGDAIPRSPSGHERIVLCEDEPAVRQLVAAVLRRSGYSVAVATTPSEALLLIGDRSAPADLLLTDVVMPGMSGPELALRARGLRANLRVILMSGYARESLDREVIGWDAAFIAKPFTPARLAHVVRNVLDGLPPDDADDEVQAIA